MIYRLSKALRPPPVKALPDGSLLIHALQLLLFEQKLTEVDVVLVEIQRSFTRQRLWHWARTKAMIRGIVVVVVVGGGLA